MLSLEKQRNSKIQGDVGLGVAIAWFVQNDYRVAIPLTDSQDYDLVIEINGAFSSVQVRTTYYERYDGIYQVDLRVCGGNRSGTGKTKNFDPDLVDYLFAVTNAGDKYFIPCKDIQARQSINLGAKYAQYKVT